MKHRLLGDEEARCFSLILPVELVSKIDREIQHEKGVSRSSYIRGVLEEHFARPVQIEVEALEPPKPRKPRPMRRRGERHGRTKGV